MKRPLTLILTIVALHNIANALTAYSVSSGNWNSTSTWFLGIVPGSGDDAVIANSNTVTVTGNTTCASLTIGNGLLNASTGVQVNSGVTLTVTGNISIVAPLLGTTDNFLNVNAGTVTCASLTTSNSLSNDKRCVVNITTGRLTCSGSFIMANNTTRNKLIFSSSGVLQIGGNASTILDAQFTPSTGTVEYTSSATQSILVLSYYTLKCSGTGTKTLTSNMQVNKLIVSAGSKLDVAVGNSLSVSDAFTNNASITGSGTVVLNGTAAQTIDGNGTMTNLRLNNSSGATILNNSGNMVTITSKYTPTAGVLTTNDKMTFKSDASGTAVIMSGASGGGYISGKVILERYVPGRRAWRLFTFPITTAGAPTINEALQEGAGGNASSNPAPGYGTHITGGTIANGFDQNPINNPSMKELVSGNWQGIGTTNQSITNKDVYLLFIRGSRSNNLSQLTSAATDNTTIRIKGNAKQGDKTVSISGAGWKLVYNPFHANINLNSIALDNSSVINRNFSFWDPKMGGSNNVGAYVTASYNGSGYDFVPTPTSSLSEYAQPFSVFFVDAKAAGTLAINESHKCNCGNDNVFRPLQPGVQQKIRVDLKSVNSDDTAPVVDGVLAAYGTQFSNEIDEYDAENLPNIGAENLAISRQGKQLAIERRTALTTGDTLQLRFSNVKIKTYQLEVSADNFDSLFTTAYIQDSYTGASVPVHFSQPTLYTFSITNDTGSYSVNRLRLVIQSNPVYVLPVKISLFKAVPQKEGAVLLEWKAENEESCVHYVIEKSTDGIQFTRVAEVLPGSINGYYSFTDKHTVPGENYYRIKLKEKNEGIVYSNTVKALISGDNDVQIFYSSLVNSTLQLKLGSLNRGRHHIAVYDINGQKVLSADFEQKENNSYRNVLLRSYLPAGIYNAVITTPLGKKKSLRLLAE